MNVVERLPRPRWSRCSSSPRRRCRRCTARASEVGQRLGDDQTRRRRRATFGGDGTPPQFVVDVFLMPLRLPAGGVREDRVLGLELEFTAFALAFWRSARSSSRRSRRAHGHRRRRRTHARAGRRGRAPRVRVAPRGRDRRRGAEPAGRRQGDADHGRARPGSAGKPGSSRATTRQLSQKCAGARPFLLLVVSSPRSSSLLSCVLLRDARILSSAES